MNNLLNLEEKLRLLPNDEHYEVKYFTEVLSTIVHIIPNDAKLGRYIRNLSIGLEQYYKS